MGGDLSKVEVEMEYFVRVDVWTVAEEGRLICYRCLQVLPGMKYFVQSADSFYDPVSNEDLLRSEKQFVELMFDRPECRPKRYYDTAEEAIEAHNRDFAWAKELVEQLKKDKE